MKTNLSFIILLLVCCGMVVVQTGCTKKSTNPSTPLELTNSGDLVPPISPFNYNVGINYDSWTDGRANRSIPADLDEVTRYFKLIKTFIAAGVGGGTIEVVMDPTQKEVVDYIVAHQAEGLELAMGTNISSIAAGGWNSPWTPGLMTQKSYTDKWVQMVIEAFGSTAIVKKSLKVIFLGNEADMNGPGPDSSEFKAYYSEWIPRSFDNLKASLQGAGLGSIPVTTIMGAYHSGVPTPQDSVRVQVTRYITEHWSPDWNSGKPFVMFNDYTKGGSSTDFGAVISYFEMLVKLFNGTPYVYVGETGYSAEYGATNQVDVVNQIFTWLDGQYKANKKTIPLFVFMAFDRSAKRAGQRMMGIFKDDASNKPLGLKDGITVPAWIKEKRPDARIHTPGGQAFSLEEHRLLHTR
ncbi:MAG: hypothetical protein HQ542_02865 [Bacteroidia bacterium]|nr:hypothetical protein [Bacteroidia bacterium]